MLQALPVKLPAPSDPDDGVCCLESLHAWPIRCIAGSGSDRRGRPSHPVFASPADRRLAVVDGLMRLTSGPKENFTRPGIDSIWPCARRSTGRERLRYVERSTTPTLVLQGSDDQRCPRCQAEQFSTSLMTETSKPAEMIIYRAAIIACSSASGLGIGGFGLTHRRPARTPTELSR
jgi:pimeloyl-ACP methyl ester carboxylesterase